MCKLQDTQTIEGSSRGGSVSGGLQGVTGASANAGETSGEQAWVSQTTGINGSESITVNVGGTTTLTGASITNQDENGQEQGTLEVNTQHLVVNDIQDIDTCDANSRVSEINRYEIKKMNHPKYARKYYKFIDFKE